MKSVERLKQIGYANYKELFMVGIKCTYTLGTDRYGHAMKVIETKDGSQWEYKSETGLYDLLLDKRVTAAILN